MYREPPSARTEREIDRAFHDDGDHVAIPGFPVAEAGAAQPASIGIAGVTPASLGPEPPAEELPEQEPELAPRREDIPIVLTGAILAATVFMPWYKTGGTGAASVNVSGWASGTWGPLIFFLGLGAVAVVLLRRVRIAVKLPFPESIMLEGFGWLATLTAILKARFRPAPSQFLQLQTVSWVYLAVAAGIALALLAGRVSGKTPFVPVPGWHRGRAGKVGALVLVVVLAGGASFGFMNKYKPSGSTNGGIVAGPTNAPQVVKGLPPCAKDFPVPPDFTPFNGIESKNALKTCVATFQTTKSTTDAASLLGQAFTRGGWTFQKTATGQAFTFQITKPKCGSATIISSANKTVYAVINVSLCAAK